MLEADLEHPCVPPLGSYRYRGRVSGAGKLFIVPNYYHISSLSMIVFQT